MIQNLLSYHLANISNIAINFQMFLNNYHYILSNYTLALLSFALSFLCIIYFTSSPLQLMNRAQFLNITPLFLSSTCFSAASAPAPVIAILPLTSM